MQPLKIAFVFDDSLDKPDGVQQYVLTLGEWLRSQGHEVHYLVGATIRKDIPRIHSMSRNIGVRFNGNRLSMPLPASRQAIRKLLVQEAFDVLHVQIPYSPFMAKRVILAAPSSTAVVGTFHILPDSQTVARLNQLLGVWLQRSLKRFNHIVSVSVAAQQFAKEAYHIESGVLPNVFDYARFHSAQPIARDASRPTILFLGRLVPRKGCKLLLKAVKLMGENQALPAFRVLICGKGPLDNELKAYAQTNHLHNVEFMGFVDEAAKPGYYASADISVFPSRGGESFGIVLLEAMASGKAAVLAGNNPGYASVLGSDSPMLFDARSAQDLAQKLSVLLSDMTRRRQLAMWGEKHAEQFDVSTVGRKLSQLYEQALQQARNVR